jgi:hypothetical protein
MARVQGAHLEGGHSYTFFNSTAGLLGHKRSLYEGNNMTSHHLPSPNDSHHPSPLTTHHSSSPTTSHHPSGGMRSPSMVRWPGTIKPGVVSDFQVSALASRRRLNWIFVTCVSM